MLIRRYIIPFHFIKFSCSHTYGRGRRVIPKKEVNQIFLKKTQGWAQIKVWRLFFTLTYWEGRYITHVFLFGSGYMYAHPSCCTDKLGGGDQRKETPSRCMAIRDQEVQKRRGLRGSYWSVGHNCWCIWHAYSSVCASMEEDWNGIVCRGNGIAFGLRYAKLHPGHPLPLLTYCRTKP